MITSRTLWKRSSVFFIFFLALFYFSPFISTVQAAESFTYRSQCGYSNPVCISKAKVFDDRLSACGGELTCVNTVDSDWAAQKSAILDPTKEADRNQTKPGGESPFNCGFIGKSSLGGCIGHIIYYVWFTPATWAIGLAGWFFDILAAFTLSTVVMDAKFVGLGWAGVRDITNMVFIFALLAIAIATILQVEEFSAKRVLARLVVIALVVNFSLFVSRVIIDAGNISALFFYDRISAPSGATTNIKGGEGRAPKDALSKPDALGVQVKSISELVVNGIRPQAIFGNPELLAGVAASDPGRIIVLYLFIGALIFAAAWIFFSVGIIFLGRVGVLWLLMILSPLAFAAMIFPKTKQYADRWWKELVNQSFLVAIFLFFVYLAVLVGSTGPKGFLSPIFKNPSLFSIENAQDTALFIVISALYYGIILMVLQIAKKTAVKMSGEMGTHAVGLGKGLAKFGAGLALGPLAGLGRMTLGRAATGLLQSEGVKNFAARTGAVGRMGVGALRGISGGSLDPRSTALGSKLGLKGGGAGGYEGKAAAEAKSRAKYMEYLAKGEKGKERREEYAQHLADKYGTKSLMGKAVNLMSGHWAEGGRRTAKAYGDEVKARDLKTTVSNITNALKDLNKQFEAANARIVGLGPYAKPSERATLVADQEKIRTDMQKRQTELSEAQAEAEKVSTKSLEKTLSEAIKSATSDGGGTTDHK